jgi:phenylacetic acid degradation operon negative regulatory protein
VSAEPVGERASPTPRRPQQLLLSLLGALVLDRDLPAIGSRVFLHLLGELGVTEAAGRATLARMSRKGILERLQDGRTARYSVTESGADMLREARERVFSPTPFTHPEASWTLLSYSMPESRRDLRHQVRARLTWAGFRGLRDGLWIAPGRVDVARVLAGEVFHEVDELAEAFYAQPTPDTDVARLVHRAWDVDAIRAEHQRFLAAWEPEDAVEGPPLARLTLLGADWLQLLRTDPGLPAEHLPGDWPATRSAKTYRARFDALEPPADDRLRRLISSDALRR